MPNVFEPLADAIDLWSGQKVPLFDEALDQRRPSLSLYAAKGVSLAKAIIVCPGGGYHRKAAHEGHDVARFFSDQGFHCFILDYRVAPYRYPCAYLDVRRALSYVRYHAKALNVLEDGVGVLGFSAGGHLAATASCLWQQADFPQCGDSVDGVSSRPDFSVLCYPVIELAGALAHEGSANNLLGEDAEETLRESLSFVHRVNEQTPPSFLWHTVSDSAVPVENSMAYAAALRKYNRPFALHLFPLGRHGLGIKDEEPGVNMWADLCVKWLQ